VRTYYALKWVDSKGRGTGGSRPYQYDLPKRGKPGRWHRKHKEAIRLCENGFHCTGLSDYAEFSDLGPRLFIVEIKGKFSSSHTKVAVEAMRFIVEVPISKDESGELNTEWIDDSGFVRVTDSIFAKIIIKYVFKYSNKLVNGGVIMASFSGGSGTIGKDILGKYFPISLPSC